MEALAELGSASFSAPEGHGMTRNIALPDAEYEEIKQLYASGAAPWFAADGF
jgi:hypothetical protein